MGKFTVRKLAHAIAGGVAACMIFAAVPASMAQAEETEQDKLTITLTRTDTLGDTVYVGDILRYTVNYTNNSNEPLTVFPAESNLDGVLTSGTPNCRWSNLGAGKSAQCTTATHVLTKQDVDAGGFEPRTVWKATHDRAGNDVVQEGIQANASRISISEGSRPVEPDEATIPTERAEGEGLVIAYPGQYGVACYRIPAIAKAPNGWILTAWDSRPSGCGDAPQPNSIVQRISKDGGKSFETRTVAAAGMQGAQKYGYSDPSYVVDYETGEIFLFFVKSFDQGWGGSQAGTDPTNRNVLHAAVTSSKDNGLTWSEPRVITDQITNNEAWRSRFAASGAGIQLKYGEHKGRLVQQYTINNNNVWQAVSVYSDDHGATWHAGEPVGTGMDENKVVELSDGRLMINSRPSQGGYRKIAFSSDGGETYTGFTEDTELPDPHNNAQIIRAFPDAPQGSAAAKVLLYSSSSPQSRSNGLVRISFDDGENWSMSKQFKSGYMAYSVLAALGNGRYGLLYEGDAKGGNSITYTQISLDWLGAVPVTAGGEVNVPEGAGIVKVNVPVENFADYNVTNMRLHTTAPSSWMAENASKAVVKPGRSTVPITVYVPESAKAGKSVKVPITVTGDSENVSQGQGMNGEITINVVSKPSVAVTQENAEVISVAKNEKLTLTVRNLAEGTKVRFVLHSDPIELGTAVADSEGVATLETSVPEEVVAGNHVVHAHIEGMPTITTPLTIEDTKPETPDSTDNGTSTDTDDKSTQTDPTDPTDTEESKDTDDKGTQTDPSDDKKDKGDTKTNPETKPETKQEKPSQTESDKAPAKSKPLATTGVSIAGVWIVALLCAGITGVLLVRRKSQR